MGKDKKVIKPIGLLKWAKREHCPALDRQTAYYDHSVYKVPVVGTVDCARIREALSDKFPPQFTNFGGYSTVGCVEPIPDEPNAVLVEMIYHIGE
jgi:hypothetical protein